MKTEKLEITSSFRIEHFTESWGKGISFDYIEHTSDHWHSDRETSVDIDEEMARKIVDLLKNHFNI